MGFIAENIRENIQEHEIEKRNMELIVDNLKEDTTWLNFTIRKNTQAVILIDSLLLLRDKSLKDSNTIKIFYTVRTNHIHVLKKCRKEAEKFNVLLV